MWGDGACPSHPRSVDSFKLEHHRDKRRNVGEIPRSSRRVSYPWILLFTVFNQLIISRITKVAPCSVENVWLPCGVHTLHLVDSAIDVGEAQGTKETWATVQLVILDSSQSLPIYTSVNEPTGGNYAVNITGGSNLSNRNHILI